MFVCRGKVSEGIDFPDDLCRAVIMLGVPLPNPFDPIIQEKMKHFAILAKKSSSNDDIP